MLAGNNIVLVFFLPLLLEQKIKDRVTQVKPVSENTIYYKLLLQLRHLLQLSSKYKRIKDDKKECISNFNQFD